MTDSEQKASPKREVIVVLGVGRSGTSLAMQALESLGVRVSQNLIPPNVSNPKGFYEDADIVEIHKHLLSTLAPSPAMPLQEGWMNTPEARQALAQLKEIVEANVNTGDGPWAFKDPRTATLLPLWIRLFNHLKVVPRFVLAVRRPEAFIQSFANQSGKDDQFYAELIFLQRALDALHHTAGNCLILQHESWFTESSETLQKLADFVYDQPTDITDKVAPVSEALKRSSNAKVQVVNPLVNELYENMRACAQHPEQRDVLMECVQRQRAIVAAFKPWFSFAENQKKLNTQCREQMTEAAQQKSQLTSCRQRLERQAASLGQYQQAFHDVERLYLLTE